MATGDTKATRSFLELQADGTAPVDFNSDTVKLMLIKSSHTPDYAGGDVYAGSLTATQVTAGTAYTNGGVNLASLSVTVSGSFAIFKAGTISIAQDAAGFATARYGAIYKLSAGSTMANSPIIAFVDLGSDRANTAGPLLIYWTSNKILKWQY
jgi:hypothetical protein